jgi:hypothetical protein
MTLFFTYRAEIPKRKKLYIVLSYAIIISIIGAYALLFGIDIAEEATETGLTFDYVDFLAGFTTWTYHLREDIFFLLFVLPLAVGLFLTSRNGIKQADSILILIAGIALAMPLLAAFTEFRLHPYRLVPLLIFFAMGIGMLFSNRLKQQV